MQSLCLSKEPPYFQAQPVTFSPHGVYLSSWRWVRLSALLLTSPQTLNESRTLFISSPGMWEFVPSRTSYCKDETRWRWWGTWPRTGHKCALNKHESSLAPAPQRSTFNFWRILSRIILFFSPFVSIPFYSFFLSIFFFFLVHLERSNLKEKYTCGKLRGKMMSGFQPGSWICHLRCTSGRVLIYLPLHDGICKMGVILTVPTSQGSCEDERF